MKHTGTTIAELLLFGLLLLLCGNSMACRPMTREAHVTSEVVDEVDRLPPQQVHKALRELASTQASQQSSGLTFVEKFPSILLTHRNVVESLAENGASKRIRDRAKQLLARLPFSSDP